MKRAFALIRVSSKAQETQSQLDALRKVAKNKGYEIKDEDVFEEKISGYDEDVSHDRDSIVQLKDQIKLHKPDAIFLWELSRLTRRAIKVSKYIQELSINPSVPMYFADYDVWTLDPDNPTDVKDENIMQLVGGAKSVEIERERIKARTARGRNAKAEQGFYVGHLSDGYAWEQRNGEKVIIIDKDRAPMIKLIYEMYVKNEYSTSEIRDILNADIDKYPPTNRYRLAHETLFSGYKDDYQDRTHQKLSRRNSYWSDVSVAKLMKDTWYKGVRFYKKREYPVPPIVDEDLWNKAQERLKSLRFAGNHTKPKRYFLAGKLFCGNCGRKLYGHRTEYYNMYYCASKEYGQSVDCGLPTIRQENVDAIVFNIVKMLSICDIQMGEKTVLSSYFEADKSKLNKLNEDIKVRENVIRDNQGKIDTLNREISFMVEQQTKHRNNADLIEKYDCQINKTYEQIRELENKIYSYQIEIDRLGKLVRLSLSVKDKILRISNMTDFDEIKDMLSSVIERVVIYDAGNSSMILEITYTNGQKDYALYNPRRMSRKYIFLSRNYLDWMHVQYNNGMFLFEGYYLLARPNRQMLLSQNEIPAIDKQYDKLTISFGVWDTEKNYQSYQLEVKNAIDRGFFSNGDREELERLYRDAQTNGTLFKSENDFIRKYEEDGYKVYKNTISVIDYVNIFRKKGSMNLYSYEDLFPISEKGLERKKWHQEYAKKYNNGNPTFTPYVEKGASYEEICKQRKYLYNRKYKILHNHSLSDEQKEQQIMDVMRKLEAYKYQIKYLPSNKRGEKLAAKYNNK